MENLRSIESEANFEGNASEVLFSRLHNEKIRRQIIDLLLSAEKSQEGTFIQSLETDDNGDLVFNASGEPIIKENVPFVPETREELENRYDEALAQIESFTEIDYSKHAYDLPTVDKMYIGAISPWSGKPFTSKEMSIAEAHEKGHRIRNFDGDFFEQRFKPGFDFADVPFGEEVFTVYRKALRPEDRDKPLEEVKQLFFEYITTPSELVERMSQLKNYYGMRTDEVFTKEHLDHARAHYIPDTGMDNGMTQFFQAITPETEGEFLRLINSVGV